MDRVVKNIFSKEDRLNLLQWYSTQTCKEIVNNNLLSDDLRLKLLKLKFSQTFDKPSVEQSQIGHYRQSPLDMAILRGNDQMIELLTEYGAAN